MKYENGEQKLSVKVVDGLRHVVKKKILKMKY